MNAAKTCARYLCLGAMILFGALGAAAQTTVTKTVGTQENYNANTPFCNVYPNGWTQTIYPSLAIDLPNGGTITKIAFNSRAIQNAFAAPHITIYMGHTDDTVVSSTTDWVPLSALTQVYAGYEAQPFTTGWNTITLDTPFDYNGSDHLVLCVLRQGSSRAAGQTYYYTKCADAGVFMYKSNATSHPGTAAGSKSTMRANIRITAIPNAGCLPPQDATVGNITRTSATLSITPPAGTAPSRYYVEYRQAGDPSTRVALTPSTPRALLGNLQPGTEYEYFVRSICAPGDTSTAASAVAGKFVTLCAPYPVPFVADFSSIPTYNYFDPRNEVPVCWSFPHLAATTSTYPQSFIVRNSFVQLLTRERVTAFAVLPMLEGDLRQTVFSFEAGVPGVAGTSVHYGYLTDPDDTAAFVPLGLLDRTGSYSFDLSSIADPVPHGAHLAFRYRNSTFTTYTATFSNISVTPVLACTPPTGFGLDSACITLTSLRLVWGGDQNPGDTYRIRSLRSETDTDTVRIAEGITQQHYLFDSLVRDRYYRFLLDKKCGSTYTEPVIAEYAPVGRIDAAVIDGEHGYVYGKEYGKNGGGAFFTAIPNPHYTFDKWDDGLTSNPRFFYYSSEGTITPRQALFIPDTHNITVNAINPLFGSVSNHTGRHAHGTVLHLTATPEPGYKFVGWSDGTSTPAYDYTVRRDASLIAYFCAEDLTMILGTINDPTLGSVTTSPAGGVVTLGQTVTITATVTDPDHYSFRFNPEIGTITSSGNTHTLTVVADTVSMTIAGVIEPAKFTVAATDYDTNQGSVFGLGTYEYGDRVQLAAMAAQSNHFVMWRGDAFTNANPLTVQVNTNKTLKPVFVRDSITLVLRPSYADRGTVEFTGMPGVTSRRVAVGDSIDVSAFALEHYSFHSWSNGAVTSTQTYVAIGTDGSTRYLTAYFQPDMHYVTATPADSAMGTTEGSAFYGYATVARLDAIPNHGYYFLRWDNGSTDNPYRPTVYNDKNYTAHFAPIPLSIMASPDDPAHGAASVSGNMVYMGAVTLSADTVPGWSFLNWTDAHGTIVSTDRVFTFQATADSAFVANYVRTPYTVTFASEPAGMGIITPDAAGLYHYGDTIRVSATPYDATLYEFSYWSIDASTNDTLEWVVTSSARIVAHFNEMAQFVINVTSNNPTWGTTYTDKASYTMGQTAIITAEPSEHHEFRGWSDGETYNHRVMTVTGDTSFVAIFAPKTYSLSARSSDNAKGFVSGSGRYPYDTIVSVVATPLMGQHVSGWQGASGSLPTVNIRLTSDSVVTAQFATSNMPIAVSGVNATTSGSGHYPYGSTVTISATPDPYYQFTHWSDGNIINPRTIVVDSTSNYVAFTSPINCTITVVPNDPFLGRVVGSDIRPFGSRPTRIEAIPYAHCRFLRWDDGETAASRIVAYDAHHTYTAIFARDSFDLRLVAPDPTLGTVNIDANGTYIYDSRVEVRATPNNGVVFTEWSDGVTDNPRILTMTTNILDLTARFDSVAYTLDTATNNSLMGHIEIDPAKDTYHYGEVITVSCENHDDNLYRFVAWEDASTSPVRTITVEGNLYIRAIFADADRYTVAALSNNPAMGTALGSANGVANGSSHELRARAAEHCKFVGWSDGVTDSVRNVTVNGNDIVLVATFAADSHTVAFATTTHGTLSGAGRYAYGTVASLYATPADHYHFVSWSDGVTANPRLDTIKADITLGATFAIDSFTVNVVADHAATVTGAGRYAYNSLVTLRVTPEVNYHFANWSRNGALVTTYALLPSFRATEDVTYVANFAIDSVTVTVNSNSREYGYVNGIAMGTPVKMPYGSSLNLEAVALNHRTFSQWSNGETNANYSLVLTKDTTLKANFIVDSFTVNIVSADGSMGTVNSAAVGSRKYAYGEVVSLEATPATGFEFLYWTPGNIVANPLNLQVVDNHTYTAWFVSRQLLVVAQSSDPAMGNVTVAPIRNTYAYNESITLTATPAAHHHFEHWSDGSTDAVRTFNVTVDTLLVATFAIDTVRLTLAANDDAMGTVSGAGVYDWNSTVTVYATANDGYHFLNWSDGNSDNPRQLTLTAATTLTATFASDTHYASVSVVSNNSQWGTATASESRVITGNPVTLTATAAEHYHFVRWSDGNTDAVRTFNVTVDTLLVATFAIDTVRLTLAANDDAMGTVSGAGVYDWNSTVTVYATANAGHHFTGWSDGISDNPRQLTLTADFALTALFAEDIIVPDSVLITAFAVNGTVTGAGLYEVGEEVTLIATAADTTFIFSNWVKDGSAIDGNDTLTFTADASASFVAIFIPDTTTVVVPDSVLITAFAVNGTVSGAGLYEVGEEVTLIATAADTTYVFAGWVKNGSAIDGSDTLTFTADASASFVALFDAVDVPHVVDTFMLTVLSADETMGTVSGGGRYETRELVPVVATPATGYDFVGWSDGVAEASRLVYVTSDSTLTAHFAIRRCTVTLHGEHAELLGAGTYDYGTTVTVTATPDEGYEFVRWVDAAGATVSTEASYAFTVTTGMDLTAEVQGVALTVSGEASPAVAGFINGLGSYRYGDTVTLTAQAREGYRFVDWSLPWDIYVSEAYYTFVVRENVHVVANFTEVGIDDVDGGDVTVYAAGNRIRVLGAEGRQVRVFDAVGRLVNTVDARSAEVEIAVPATGIYMVQVGNATAKRVVVMR